MGIQKYLLQMSISRNEYFHGEIRKISVIVDSFFMQDITKTSKSGISCTCLDVQHLEEELGLVVLISVSGLSG